MNTYTDKQVRKLEKKARHAEGRYHETQDEEYLRKRDRFNDEVNILKRNVAMNKKNKNRLSKSESINPNHFIERFCNRLKLDEEDIKIILLICEFSMKNNIISENTPPSIAAGCIFYYIKDKEKNISKKDISEICKISEVTNNKCTKKLELHDSSFCKILK